MSISGSSTSIAGISAGKTPRSPKNSRRSTGTSDRARNACSASIGIRFKVASATSRISRIGIFEQQDQDRELLVRAWRQRALRRQHPDVARHFAPPEEIEQRSGSAHRVDEVVFEIGQVQTRGHDFSLLAERLRCDTVDLMASADASPTVSTISRRTSIVRCSPGCSRRSSVFSPSTVADTQHSRSADNETRQSIDGRATVGRRRRGLDRGSTGRGAAGDTRQRRLSSTAPVAAAPARRTPGDAEIDHRGRYRNAQRNRAARRWSPSGARFRSPDGPRTAVDVECPAVTESVRKLGDEFLNRRLRIEADFDRVRPDECPAENPAGQARHVVALERFERAHRRSSSNWRSDAAICRGAHALPADCVRNRAASRSAMTCAAIHVRKASRACQTIR